jgi:NTE family protein
MPLERALGAPRTAFVLGGGGVHGAAEVGMLRALHERGIRADLVLGTSIGALNGAVYADDPERAVERLVALWTDVDAVNPFEAGLIERAATVARSWTHLHGNHRLHRLLLRELGDRRFEDLAVPFACVAASIERAAPRWFDSGPLIPALLATTAIPGLLPPVEIDGEHLLDGGLVDSIPVDRALELGATTVYVLQVGRVEHPLEPPSRPWEVAMVAFEIARRSRFSEAMARVPPEVDVHVLPSSTTGVAPGSVSVAQLLPRDADRVTARIDDAHAASRAYLDRRVPRAAGGASGTSASA